MNTKQARNLIKVVQSEYDGVGTYKILKCKNSFTSMRMMQKHHLGGDVKMKCIGDMISKSSRSYLSFAVDEENTLIMFTYDCNDSICEHGNRICFCGEWTIGANAVVHHTQM